MLEATMPVTAPVRAPFSMLPPAAVEDNAPAAAPSTVAPTIPVAVVPIAVATAAGNIALPTAAAKEKDGSAIAKLNAAAATKAGPCAQ